jgi:selenoprotein W-related protein
VRLAGLLKQHFSVEAKLVPGSGGVFDVHVEGKKVFSKHDEGRFPDEDEIIDQIADQVASA